MRLPDIVSLQQARYPRLLNPGHVDIPCVLVPTGFARTSLLGSIDQLNVFPFKINARSRKISGFVLSYNQTLSELLFSPQPMSRHRNTLKSLPCMKLSAD